MLGALVAGALGAVMLKNPKRRAKSKRPAYLAALKPAFVVLEHGPNPDIDGGYWGGVPSAPRTQEVPVSSFKDASAKCLKFIADQGLGGGNWAGRAGYILDAKRRPFARVSYNGRVWEGTAWTRDAKEIKVNPLKYDERGTSRVGPYTFHVGDAAYAWTDYDSDAEAIWVEAFDQPFKNDRAGRSMFWDAVQTFIGKSMGRAVVGWYTVGKGRYREWVIDVMERKAAKKNGIPFITRKMAVAAREAARSGKVPRSVKALQSV